MSMKQAGNKMQGGSTGNVIVPRDMRIQAGNANTNERERMKAVQVERHKEISGSIDTLHSPTKVAQKEIGEAEIYAEAEASQP